MVESTSDNNGKKTLADQLIAAASGNMVHPKVVGKVRFMDYLDEEQRRAITMKSSSNSLHYNHHTVNLIDCLGHIDFVLGVRIDFLYTKVGRI
jgi:ribosome assembly protein 1